MSTSTNKKANPKPTAPTTPKTPFRGEHAWTKKQRLAIWEALQKVLTTETADDVYDTATLVRLVRAYGVYCTPTTVQDCLRNHKVPCAVARKYELFAKQAKAKIEDGKGKA